MATKTVDLKKSYLFELCKKDESQIKTKEGATGFPSLYDMRPKCVAMYPNDEGKLEPQTLRYIKGETDLRMSKQRKDITRSQEKPIPWVNGQILVSAFEPLLLKFFEYHSGYESNENRDETKEPLFKLIDKQAIKKKELDEAKIKIEAEALAMDIYKNDGEGFISLCEALGIDIGLEPELMFHALLVRLRRNPDLFLKQLKDPTMKSKAFFKKAIREGVIKVVGNSVVYGDGSTTGFTCPIGQKTEDAFILWFDSKQGKAVLDQIKFRLANPIEQL